MATKSGDQGLRDWFGKSKSSDGKPGWVQLGGKFAGKPCARQPGQTSTPKCGSSKMAANLSDEEEERARRRKNRQDPNQPEKSGGAKPTNVRTEGMDIQEVKDKPGKGSGKKDSCYHKVKSRYSVWPSAYASGALVKCRKVGAANWGNKSESYEFSNWRDDFQATEYEFVDLIKPEPLKGEQIDEGQKCWKGYEKKGTKKMFGKTYNNCVKKEGYAPGDVDQKVGAVTPISKDEREAAKQRLLAKAKAKREKMKEEKEESNIGGGNLQKLSKKATKRIDYDVDGDVDPNDKVEKKTGEYGEELPTPFGKFRTGDSKKVKVKKEEFFDWREELSEASVKKYCPKCKKVETKSQCAYGPKYWEDNAEEVESGDVSEGAAWTKKSGKSESGGLNEKGRKSYERENPGSDLKAPSKKVGNPRRKSFCARMKGMKKKLTSSKTANDPDSRINKSLRAWNC